ncbi:MAG: PilZ domain-containing protein [Gammaproteobacteria bacterium]|nr:PilZ domain-containing protein [Gammaproteobacteria bacterium]
MVASHEKRHFARFKFDGTTEVHYLGKVFPAELIDISLRGALITKPADIELPLDSVCDLHIILEGSDIVINMSGHITHRLESQVGICCDNIDLDSVTHLKRLVELNLGDESQLERELQELIKD